MADATQGVDLLTALGGSGGTTGAILFAYHNYFSNKNKKDVKEDLKPSFDNIKERVVKLGEEVVKAKAEGIKNTDRSKKNRDKIDEDRNAFMEFASESRKHIERIDNAESRIEDVVAEVNHKIEKNADRVETVTSGHNMLELRLNAFEERERKHYEELSKMNSDNKVMDQRLTHIEQEASESKMILMKLSETVQDLRDAVVKLSAKLD